MNFILSIDQGTSGTKALVFDADGQAIARGSVPLQTHYFGEGFVEQDPEAIYNNVVAAVSNCLNDLEIKGLSKEQIIAIGISNQRETFVLWDESGSPLHPAIVWQCKRSVKICENLAQRGLGNLIASKTGLVIDPYFSATKLVWLVENNTSIKEAVAAGKAFFGTIDTWLLYKLTAGKSYATDHTNASRTLFFNIQSLQWDTELLDVYGLGNLQLPEVKSSSAYFGETTINDLLSNPVAITGLIGDSHAAAFGEGCFDTGTAKATLGTGSSIIMNIGNKPVASQNGMVTTICWSVPGRVDYALEGVIVTCGGTIEWLKNELGLFDDVKATTGMANAVSDNGGVYLVPAFSGLGSPHWEMNRKASITGMTFGTNKNHIVRAALESIPYQIKDVIAAMEKDTGISLKQLMTNGGLTANEFVMQLLTDVLAKPVSRSSMPDVSALGAAYMAGMQQGIYNGIDALRNLKSDKVILGQSVEAAKVTDWYQGWLQAVDNKN
ncbi:FGGY family carbohydrate kinase [Niabella hibiscisoli]|uniref:FGGY family carbohydrate kinase n=1 Tax=Niabella hibiscisoli TaxID=1825928 RepID=UPI001F10AB3B|nr:glycerol kinase GlpK [Niabella hibiscisoli]MCH5720220.1 glycerol kinase GlpK [Niabella hibiscisoli]